MFIDEMVQVHKDKTSQTLKENKIAAYPVYAVLLNFMQISLRYFFDQGNTLVVLLLVCTKTNEKDQRKKKLENSYEVERSVVSLYDALAVSMEKTQETRNYKYSMKKRKKAFKL